jgi:hypothetical protein
MRSRRQIFEQEITEISKKVVFNPDMGSNGRIF